MIHKNREHRIDTIFVLIIFCVFAVSVLMVLVLGASTYEKVTEMSRDGYTDRSVLSYIWTKVKNSDESGMIYIGDFHGLSALYIEEYVKEELGDTLYQTAIYQYNGWVYELLSEEGLEFYPEDGSQIIRLDDLKFQELENGLIKVSSEDRSLLIYPRSRISRADSNTVILGDGVSG